MFTAKSIRRGVAVLALVALSGCGGGGLGSIFGGMSRVTEPISRPEYRDVAGQVVDIQGEPVRGLQPGQRPQRLTDALRRQDVDRNIAVNRYLWNASLDVLNFLPVESVDPFTGVIVFGYGTPPGGSASYRATVHIKDPALDARSLVVALQTRSGPVAAGTRRAVEDSILARARQLRIDDKRF